MNLPKLLPHHQRLIAFTLTEVLVVLTIIGIPWTTQYQLQVVSPRFDSIVKIISDTRIAINRFMMDLEKGQFQWGVKALNNSSKSITKDEITVFINGRSEEITKQSN